jgi:hypothetical protein
MDKTNYVLNKPEPAANETVWAFDLGKGSIGEAVRRGNEFPHKASLLIPAEFAETKTAAGRRRMWRTRQAHGSHRPSPAGGGMVAAASGKEAPCRSSAAVPGCGCGWRLAASSIAGRDARPTRRRDACATRFTQDYAAPTALGRIELKIPIKFSTQFGNGRILFSGPAKVLTGGGTVNRVYFQPTSLIQFNETTGKPMNFGHRQNNSSARRVSRNGCAWCCIHILGNHYALNV